MEVGPGLASLDRSRAASSHYYSRNYHHYNYLPATQLGGSGRARSQRLGIFSLCLSVQTDQSPFACFISFRSASLKRLRNLQSPLKRRISICLVRILCNTIKGREQDLACRRARQRGPKRLDLAFRIQSRTVLVFLFSIRLALGTPNRLLVGAPDDGFASRSLADAINHRSGPRSRPLRVPYAPS